MQDLTSAVNCCFWSTGLDATNLDGFVGENLIIIVESEAEINLLI